MTGLFNPKSSETGNFFCMILVAYLGHGIFHPVPVLFFSANQFWGEVLSSQIDEPQKKSGAPLSYHASPSVKYVFIPLSYHEPPLPQVWVLI